jgi:hypothetical protein
LGCQGLRKKEYPAPPKSKSSCQHWLEVSQGEGLGYLASEALLCKKKKKISIFELMDKTLQSGREKEHRTTPSRAKGSSGVHL